MKKQILIKSLLILLPVLAVGLATTLDSVPVFDTVSGTTEYYSYFDEIPVQTVSYLRSLAGVLNVVSGIRAAVWIGKKKDGCLKFSGYAGLAAAAVASVPIMMRGEILVVPNVGFPIFMLLQYVAAYFAAKLPAGETAKKKATKLKRR